MLEIRSLVLSRAPPLQEQLRDSAAGAPASMHTKGCILTLWQIHGMLLAALMEVGTGVSGSIHVR